MTKIPLLTLKHYYKPQTHSLFMVVRRGQEAGFLDRLGIFPIRDEKYRSTVDRPYNKRCQYKHNQSHVLYMKVMNQLVRRAAHVSVRWRVLEGVSIFRHIFQHIWGRILCCATGRCSVRYRRLASQSRRSSSPSPETGVESGLSSSSPELGEVDSDLVTLKISLLGDCQIGKSSFVIKYAGNEPETSILQMEGLNLTDKTLSIQDARISFSIWDVGGDKSSLDHVPIACKDSVAILFMFDLTSRCTLNSVIDWYKRARKWNKTAIPIIIGTKFDDFVKLPPNLQWTIITQARAYAKAMKATLFFSSSTHNINVNKIFKFIMAKLFNLPWTVQRNLTVGEPIIDF